MDKKILIVIIAIILLGGGIFAWYEFIREPVFIPDETIAAEVCRRVVTRAQLEKITGINKQDFIFEDRIEEWPGIGIAKECKIRLKQEPIVDEPPMGIIVFAKNISYEKIKGLFITMIIEEQKGEIGEIIEEIEDVGEKAFLVRIEEPLKGSILVFLDPDINQVVMTGGEYRLLNREGIIVFARQIEKNLKMNWDKNLENLIEDAIKRVEREAGIFRDARRRVDIGKIGMKMEIYYLDDWKYFTSIAMPTIINDFPIPKDPQYPAQKYSWIDNMANPQKFCVWADLETNGYYAASHKGTKEIDVAPNAPGGAGLDCW